ncbi:MAG TPA: SPOR domain-containing protein [Kamptonema sp.]|nr:SPOR domain-containing protein [Kamptonema sp.]
MLLKSIILHKYYFWTLVLFGVNINLLPAASGAIAPQLSTDIQNHHQLIAQEPLSPPREPAIRHPSAPPPPVELYSPPSLPDSRIQSGRYAVYVNGDSPLLLQFVRQVEPAATVLMYKERRVIAAGNFFDEISARSRVAQLQSLGIEAQITNFQDGQEFSELIPYQQPNYYPVPPSFPTTQQPNFIPATPNTLPPTNPAIGSGLYQVVVDAGSFSLAQVRRVESSAFVRQSGSVRVIQAGSFSTQSNAQRRVEALASLGIPATIIRSSQEFSNPLPTQAFSPPTQSYLPPVQPYIPPVQPYVSPAQPYIPPAQNLGQNNANSYFVVISGNKGDLPQIRQEILRLGVSGNSVVARDVPGDPHVKVGPFPDQQTAERWERYLRDSGIKTARIYFGQY